MLILKESCHLSSFCETNQTDELKLAEIEHFFEIMTTMCLSASLCSLQEILSNFLIIYISKKR